MSDTMVMQRSEAPTFYDSEPSKGPVGILHLIGQSSPQDPGFTDLGASQKDFFETLVSDATNKTGLFLPETVTQDLNTDHDVADTFNATATLPDSAPSIINTGSQASAMTGNPLFKQAGTAAAMVGVQHFTKKGLDNSPSIAGVKDWFSTAYDKSAETISGLAGTSQSMLKNFTEGGSTDGGLTAWGSVKEYVGQNPGTVLGLGLATVGLGGTLMYYLGGRNKGKSSRKSDRKK